MNSLTKVDDLPRFGATQTAFFGRQAWITAIPAGLFSRMLRRNRNRQAVAALRALDDRMLKDIGISRAQIDQVVQHGLHRR